ncbi:MAG: hypothetical protein CMJ59_14710 [Planctomycetaceae bacterium]|nr:hypothetical protein [Planctomycetaceae bacterium]
MRSNGPGGAHHNRRQAVGKSKSDIRWFALDGSTHHSPQAERASATCGPAGTDGLYGLTASFLYFRTARCGGFPSGLKAR